MKRTKWLCLLLAITTAVGLTAACSGKQPASQEGKEADKSDNVAPSGMPIVKNPISLRMVAGKAPTTAPDWNKVMLWQEYEKMTGVHVDWEMIPTDSLTEKRNIMLAGGDYPDAFFTASIPTADLFKYGSQGVFIKLNDLIDKYAPNVKKLLDEYPEVKKGLTMPDGNIYSLPMILDPKFTSVRAGGKMWLKQEWLDKLNIPEPQTTDDFYKMLKAIKEQDPNGNGQPDEVPFAAVGVGSLINYLKGAWGLGNRGNAHGNVDVDPQSGKLRFIPIDPNYKEMLQYMNRLYDEGLIAKDIFTLETSQFLAKGSQGIYGAMITTSPYTLMNQKGYVGATALAGPHGDRLYAAVGSPLASVGAFAITDHNKYPEATMRWIDYLYGDEGSKMFFMGFKDKSYEETPDGELKYTEEITNNPNGLTFEQALVKYVVWPGGGYPNIVRQKYFKGAESLPEAVAAAQKFSQYFPKEIWPPFSFTPEENEKMAALGADLTSYVNEMQAKFITGKSPFAEWDNYVATLRKMGLDEYMKIYEAAYNRYKQN